MARKRTAKRSNTAKGKIATKTPSRRKTGLKLFAKKDVRPEYIKSFWREFKLEKKPRKELLPGTFWKRKVWALSQTVLVTVRRFASKELAKKYIRNTKKFERAIIMANPKRFVLQPVQFLDVRGCYLLERVCPRPNCQTSYYNQRYSPALKRSLERKGINMENPEEALKINRIVGKAVLELRDIQEKNNIVQSLETNILFIDFDPKTKKVLFSLIDIENPESIHE